ncbi:MAG: amidase [Betaproteobacteria bacterium]|nr:amidase [Betaproteobacteria bacterium]
MPDLRYAGPAGANLLSASEAAAKIASGEITSEALVGDCLARIKARDPDIGAWACVDPEHAIGQARQLDRSRPAGPLHGVPVGIKDLLDTRDLPTGHGSAIYKGERTEADSACVAALRRAGAVILGKTSTTEFASPWAIGVKNPHDLTRTPGVSSSGSAAAVADFMVPLALGTQTGGSVIRPATYCGIIGFKATIDSLDRTGIRHLRPTLDTLGLFARSLPDIALMRRAMRGEEQRTAAGGHRPRLGLCRTSQWPQAKPETQRAFEIAAQRLGAAGAEVIETALPPVFDNALDSFRVISLWEGANALERELREHLDSMNPWLKDVAATRPSLTTDRYEAAKSHAAQCRAQLAPLFSRADALITPAAAGEASQTLFGLEDQTFCPLWTMMHGPCLTLPAFTGPHRMPIGIQIVGPIGGDEGLIDVAAWIAEAMAPLPIAVDA